MSYNTWMCPPEDDTNYTKCLSCEGKGYIYIQYEGELESERCDKCDGTGEVEDEIDGDFIYESIYDK